VTTTRRPAPLRRRPVAALLPLTLTLGACTESTRQPDAAPTAREQILDTGTAAYDLRRPLTRADAGLEEHQDSIGIQHPGSTPTIDVTVTLPDDTQLRFDTGLITVEALDIGERAGEPERLILTRAMTLDEADDELARAIDLFGLDPADVDQWRDQATRVIAGDAPSPGSTFFEGRRLDDVETYVQTHIRDDGTIGFAYKFRWHLDLDDFGNVASSTTTPGDETPNGR
jgi:hypothetical protein